MLGKKPSSLNALAIFGRAVVVSTLSEEAHLCCQANRASIYSDQPEECASIYSSRSETGENLSLCLAPSRGADTNLEISVVQRRSQACRIEVPKHRCYNSMYKESRRGLATRHTGSHRDCTASSRLAPCVFWWCWYVGSTWHKALACVRLPGSMRAFGLCRGTEERAREQKKRERGAGRVRILVARVYK